MLVFSKMLLTTGQMTMNAAMPLQPQRTAPRTSANATDTKSTIAIGMESLGEVSRIGHWTGK